MSIDDSRGDLLKCPITCELFRDPVIGSDGHTYERDSITAWIRKHATSPITREPMELSSLRPNYAIRRLVEDFLSSSVEKKYRFRLNVDIAKSKPQPLLQSSNKTIYEGRWLSKNGPSIVLIKIDGTRAKHEASFYVKLSCHPHIVRTYGLIDCDSSDSIMLVQEYAPQADLSHLFRQEHFQPTIEVLLEIFRQIADAMICLADNQIIHGDLACRNVLVFRMSSNQPSDVLVKLTDFGLTRTSSLFTLTESDASVAVTKIPIHHAAPEILADPLSNHYSEKSDVYAFALLMWEACARGTLPYGEFKTVKEVRDAKCNGKRLERPALCSEELWNIIVICMNSNPNERPNFQSINESLLKLKFQHEINRRYQNITRESMVHRQLSNGQGYGKSNYEIEGDDDFDSDDYEDEKDGKQFCRNLQLAGEDAYVNLSHGDSLKPTPGYYMPCEYCSEAIDIGDGEKHANTCHVRRQVKKVVKLAAHAPPLELSSCVTCDEIIPTSLLRIHQSTCNRHFVSAHDPSPVPLRNSPAPTNETYLHPVSIPPRYSEIEKHNFPIDRSETNQRAVSYPMDASATASSPLTEHLDIPVMVSKPPKTGFRKAFSKLKKKLTN